MDDTTASPAAVTRSTFSRLAATRSLPPSPVPPATARSARPAPPTCRIAPQPAAVRTPRQSRAIFAGHRPCGAGGARTHDRRIMSPRPGGSGGSRMVLTCGNEPARSPLDPGELQLELQLRQVSASARDAPASGCLPDLVRRPEASGVRFSRRMAANVVASSPPRTAATTRGDLAGTRPPAGLIGACARAGAGRPGASRARCLAAGQCMPARSCCTASAQPGAGLNLVTARTRPTTPSASCHHRGTGMDHAVARS